MAKLWPVYGSTKFNQGYDVMIFAVAVPPPPPPAVHYFCFRNSFRCEELIYQKWAPYHIFLWKIISAGQRDPPVFSISKKPSTGRVKIP